jgi:hypothetical protein
MDNVMKTGLLPGREFNMARSEENVIQIIFFETVEEFNVTYKL